MVDYYTPGPCQDWPVIWKCSLSGYAPSVTGAALSAASEMLYELSGQRFSQCEIAIRPCRQDCYNGTWYGRGWWGGWGYGWGGYSGGFVQPVNLGGGNWVNLTCGQCSSGCSCSIVSEVFLPGPVLEIIEVKVDGIVLTGGVDYRLDDYRKLVRLNGQQWPICNDLNKADTETGTWSVTAVYGEPVPVLGQIAVGELACEFAKLIAGQPCALPSGVTEITRQGLSMSFAEVTDSLSNFFSKNPASYYFLKTYNPNGLQSRAVAYDLDGPSFRVVGTP